MLKQKLKHFIIKVVALTCLLSMILNYAVSINSYAYTYSNETLLNKIYIARYINKYRSLYSLNSLEVSVELNQSAENHALYMKQNNSTGTIEDLNKKNFTGVYPWDRAVRLGFASSLITEEIIKSKKNPREIVDSMLADPIIRTSILNPNNTHIGIGISNEIYVLDFAQGNSLYELELETPKDGMTIVPNFYYTNIESAYKVSLTFFSKEEIADITSAEAMISIANTGEVVQLETNAKLISNTKAVVYAQPKSKLIAGKEYEARFAFNVQYVSGINRRVEKTWYFKCNNSVTYKVSSKKEKNMEIPSISNHWAYESIKDFYNNGFISLNQEMTYNPDEIITREEIADIIAKALEIWNIDNEINFKDVDINNKCYESIRKVNSCNIMQGIGNKEFGISNSLTREEMIVILANIYEQIYGNTTINSLANELKDIKSCSNWSQEKVKKMISIGLIKGKDDKTISPKDNLTKSECIVLIARLKELID